MQEQKSVAVKFLAFYTATGVGKTGLTVTVDVYDPTSTKIVTAAAATEIGGGFYYYTLAGGSTGTEGEYLAVFKTADGTVDQQHIPSLWVIGRDADENLDATISSRSVYAGADTAGTTAVLARLTATRAGYLDNLALLDAAISSRLAAAGYTAPDNAGIAAILTDAVLLLGRMPSDVWDELLVNHATAGTFGKALGTAGDPWTTDLPGAYSGSDAGAILAGLQTLLQQFASVPLTLVLPTAVAGKLVLNVGNDYKAADGTAIVWTGTFPAFASVVLQIGDVLTIAGNVGAGYLSFDMTSAQVALVTGPMEFEVIGTLASGSKRTAISGLCTAS